jgi:hypothetical protein
MIRKNTGHDEGMGVLGWEWVDITEVVTVGRSWPVRACSKGLSDELELKIEVAIHVLALVKEPQDFP